MASRPFAFLEFFAGGGMARLGLGHEWRCLMANDICEKKGRAYRNNFGTAKELIVDDVANVKLDQIPEGALLSWASFPCQDLSLAGNRQGLRAERSGTFWPFWKLMQQLNNDRRAPQIIVLENVPGAITSHKGRDFRRIIKAISDCGYNVGPLVIDAVHFVPQSRPRLFIVAVKEKFNVPDRLVSDTPETLWCPGALEQAYAKLPLALRKRWVWWNLPIPNSQKARLSDLIEDEPTSIRWHTTQETRRLLSQMSPTNLAKVKKTKALKTRVVGTVYKRTRRDPQGARIQRAEVRFDQISGCLRTPAGGSSRQLIILVEGNRIRSRLLSSREAARLMGVPDSYKLPENYNEAYHLMGDGVVVPVVTWLSEHILSPLARANPALSKVA